MLHDYSLILVVCIYLTLGLPFLFVRQSSPRTRFYQATERYSPCRVSRRQLVERTHEAYKSPMGCQYIC